MYVFDDKLSSDGAIRLEKQIAGPYQGKSPEL